MQNPLDKDENRETRHFGHTLSVKIIHHRGKNNFGNNKKLTRVKIHGNTSDSQIPSTPQSPPTGTRD